MNSSNSSHRPKTSRAHPTPSFLVILDDGTRHRVSDRELAKQMSQARTATLKRLRQSRAEALTAVADKIECQRIRRDFERAERDLDAAIRRFHKRVRVQPELRRRAPAARKRKSTVAGTGHSGLVMKARPQTSSALARLDRAGREGMMLRIRYVRAGGRHAAIGCVVRHWRYIAREAAVSTLR